VEGELGLALPLCWGLILILGEHSVNGSLLGGGSHVPGSYCTEWAASHPSIRSLSNLTSCFDREDALGEKNEKGQKKTYLFCLEVC